MDDQQSQCDMGYVVDQITDSWVTIRDSEGRVVAEMAEGTTVALAQKFAAGPELFMAAEMVLVVLGDCCKKAWEAKVDSICVGSCRFLNSACRCPLYVVKQQLQIAIDQAKGNYSSRS